MKKLITYSLILLMSLLASQMLYANSLGDKTKEAKVITSQLVEKIYPNPAYKGNAINFEFQLEQSVTINVIVLDMIGNKVIDVEQEFKAGKQNFHFHTDRLTEGVYFVNVISGEEKQVQRLIIR